MLYQRYVNDNDNFYWLKTKRFVEHHPYRNLLKVFDEALKRFKKPVAFHLVIYPESNIEFKAIWTFVKSYLFQEGLDSLYFRATETVWDDCHNGLHYHVAVFMDIKKYKASFWLLEALNAAREKGLIQPASKYIQPPKDRMHKKQYGVYLNIAERLDDAKDWLAYLCKPNTKPKGRVYSFSKIK